MAAARELLASSRLVTLIGPGGVGKTQLGLRVAEQVRRAFPDGVWLVELAALQDPDLVPQAVADALGLRDRTIRSPLAVAADYLHDRQLLLVVDNCEHLVEACGPVLAKLLGAASGLRVLATSRQLLRVEGEQVLPVGPLSAPNGEHVPQEQNLHSYEAVRLFAERAAAVVPGFEVDAGNRAAVAAICYRLDGMPLAIELATARLRALSPQQILQRLDERFQLLVGGSRAALPRHQTLRATIDWSFDLCTPEEQLLWARASTFADGFDLDAAEEVCVDGGIERGHILELVIGLVDKSILMRESHGPRARYRMLDTVREYGQDRLREAGDEEALRRRHRDYYLELAERGETEWLGPNQVDVVRRTQRDHANLRIALEFSLGTPREAPTGLRMAAALRFYWGGCGVLTEGRRWLDRALALNPEPTPTRAKALLAIAQVVLLQGDIPAGTGMADECLALARQCGDETMVAYGAFMRGSAAILSSDHALANTLLEDALARFEALGESYQTVIVEGVLALAAVFAGDVARAVARAERARRRGEQYGERWGRSYAVYALALAEYSRGDFEQATTHARESLRMVTPFNDILIMAMVVDLLAWIAAAAGEGARAATLLGAAKQIWAATGGQAQMASQDWIAPHEACERQARGILGDRAFQAAFARGTGFGLDEAIAYALGERPEASAIPTPTGTGQSPLTRREQEVAGLVAEGLTNKEIAERLVISQRTAETHVEHILAKLGFTKRSQIAAWVSEQRKPPAS